MIAKQYTTLFTIIFSVFMLLAYSDAIAQWRVRIFDKLGPGQVADTVTVTIGSATLTINIDKRTPSAYVVFNCPNGVWSYSLQARTRLYNQQGKLIFVNGQGNGTLKCDGNGDLEVAMDSSTNPASLGLRRYEIERQEQSITPEKHTPKCEYKVTICPTLYPSANTCGKVVCE